MGVGVWVEGVLGLWHCMVYGSGLVWDFIGYVQYIFHFFNKHVEIKTYFHLFQLGLGFFRIFSPMVLFLTFRWFSINSVLWIWSSGFGLRYQLAHCLLYSHFIVCYMYRNRKIIDIK